MAPPRTRPSSAGPSHSQTPHSNINRRAEAVKTSLLSTVKDTDWPKLAMNDVQALIEAIDTLPDTDRIPKDETQTPEEVKVSIELVLNELESVHVRLKEESDKYGSKKSLFRKGFKKLVARPDPSRCSGVLTACRTDVEKSSLTLSNLLSNTDTTNEQHSPQLGEDETETSSGLLGTQIPPAATTVASNAALSPATSVVYSKTSQSASVPAFQVTQLPNAMPGKGSSRRGELLDGANKALKLAEGLSGTLPVVGSYVGAVAKVGLTVVEMIQAMDDNDETAKGLGSHVYRLSNILEQLSNRPRQSESSETAKGMEDIQQTLRDVQRDIAEQQAQLGVKKFWNSSNQSGNLKKLQEKVRVALEEIQLLSNLKTSILVEELHNESIQSKHRQLLNCLGDGRYGARGEAIEDVTCLRGTRVDILERIDTWIRGGSNSERVLWIRGMAGRGKSTIASTVAHSWKDRACCAIYHFRRGQNTSNASLVCALARQLAKSLDPELRKAILSTVEEKDDIINQRLDEQFAALFTSSLRALKVKAFPIVVVVDALDECDSVDYAVSFVKLIDRHSASLPDNLKFLLTSRPEAPLLRALEPRKWHAESLDSSDDGDADIERVLHHALSHVKAEHEIEGEWPAPADITRLVEMAQGLFQWARTVVKYVDDGSPADRLAEVLKFPKAWSGVDELYTQILSRALDRVKQNTGKRNLLLSVLGTLVVAPYPVSLDIIIFLHAEHDLIKEKAPETVQNFVRREILADLSSLLFIPTSSSDPMRLMHTSIRDLLVDRERCHGGLYLVELAQNHQRLATTCMHQMNQHLRENICNLKDLSKPISEIQDVVERTVSKGVQYCCRSWSIHLTKGQPARGPGADNQSPLEHDFKSFSEEKILFWLEVMSLVECFNEATMMAKQVHQWLLQLLDEASELYSFVTLWNDVHRFTTAFSEPIVFSPIHIYVSALGHCPVKTELWKRYRGHAKVRTIQDFQPETWSPDLWASDVGSAIYSVTISPDGALVASGCHAGMIHLLDLQTGRQMRESLAGHTQPVYSVCFSPDGKLLASGSEDSTIRLWNPETGSQVGQPLTGHGSTVRSVCFSPNGKLLASGSKDSTVRLWDPQTGNQVGGPLTGHSNTVRSVCFSPDGKLLASGSKDETIRLWDSQTYSQVGQVREPPTGHKNPVYSVCFSPDGELLASGCDESTIRFWNPQTGGQLGEVSWSGKRLDHTIQKRNSGIGKSDSAYSVCFSSDGKLLASGSLGASFQVWNLRAGNQVPKPLSGHSSTVYSVCFSPDGKLLASGSEDGTVQLWDPQIGSQVAQSHTRWGRTLSSVCASPDRKLFAFGSYEKILLCDPHTGSRVGKPLTGHSNYISSLCFSPNGEILASGSPDKTIRLWDLQTGSQVGEPLIGHSDDVTSVWFSPDGKAVAGRDDSGQSMAWDVFTRQKCDIPSFIPHVLCVEDHWVTFSSSRLFWLPSLHWGIRSHRVALCEGNLAICGPLNLCIFDLSDALSLYHQFRL